MHDIKMTTAGVKTFSELAIDPIVKKNLDHAHFTTPTPIQAAALKPALLGQDVLGTAQTGTGKTLAFVLPILERLMQSRGRGVEALVLLPTRELAMQVLDTVRHVGRGTNVSAALVVGGLSERPQLEAIHRGARLVIATPGRLEDYIKRKLIHLQSVKIFVLDEADRMVDMGFLPQMRSIMNSMSRERQTMCFSATLDATIAHLVRQYLKNPVHVEIGNSHKPAEKITLRIYEVGRQQKFSLLNYLLQKHPGTYLVFTRTKHGADKLFRKLMQQGIDTGVLHGGKTQSQRTHALASFKTGRHRVLVATDIAARGIHVHGIAHVVNYDMPQAAEDFIHRVGRTGRVEEEGVATTFVMPEERWDIQTIEKKLGTKIDRMLLPNGLVSEPRSIHDEAMDGKSRRAYGRPHGGMRTSTRHFGRKRY